MGHMSGVNAFFIFLFVCFMSFLIYSSSLHSSSVPFRRTSAQFFCFVLSFLCVSRRITLEIMTLQPKCEDVETAEGVALTVTGVAQVNPEYLLFLTRFLPISSFNLYSFLAPVPDLLTHVQKSLISFTIFWFLIKTCTFWALAAWILEQIWLIIV